MLSAFQDDVFQNDAFQIYSLIEGFAFQKCAFQDDSFQVEACDATPPEEILNVIGGGVWHSYKRESIRRRLLQEDEFILVALTNNRLM